MPIDFEQYRRSNEPLVTEPNADVCLTQDDVDSILRERKTGTLQELFWIDSHSTELGLQRHQQEWLGREIITRRIAAAQPVPVVLHRQSEYLQYLYSDIPVEVQQQLHSLKRSAEISIRNCSEHKKFNCDCWLATRHGLWNLRTAYGDGSPVDRECQKLWTELETLTPEKPADLFKYIKE